MRGPTTAPRVLPAPNTIMATPIPDTLSPKPRANQVAVKDNTAKLPNWNTR